MRKKLSFILATFLATTCLMVVQKPVFLAWYAAQASHASFADWANVVWHGLWLDLTVAGYITALPLLVMLVSLWVRLAERLWRGILISYFVLVSLVASVAFAVNIGLYKFWGFPLDGTILIYLSNPKEAMASVDQELILRQTLLLVICAGLMIWMYWGVTKRYFDGEPLPWRRALSLSLVMLLLGGVDFLAIRGGLGASVANVSKVYFSPNPFLNHAATNPTFSFLSSLGDRTDYAAEYPFFDEATRAAKFEKLRGNGPVSGATEKVLTTERPNVVVVLLESFSRTLVDAKVDSRTVMPNMQRLKSEGIWFENFFANSFRTDRGEVAVLSGFPAQTQISIMKLPAKSRNLPSLARSLGHEGYVSSFTYGGDLNFTNQASYMYATGWQTLIWQKDLLFDAPTGKWGYDDAVMCNYFADRIITLDKSGKPFLAGFLTLSSHEPFEVPATKFADPLFNAMAFSDECVGRMIDQLKNSTAWKNLLIVLVADHGYPYPADLAYNAPQRYRIPMLWIGGAVARPQVVEEYASQIDICATVLAQMGISHSDFDYSKNIFAPAPPRKFAYYTTSDGFGVVDAGGQAVWNVDNDWPVSETDPELTDIGRTLLQTTYTDIGIR